MLRKFRLDQRFFKHNETINTNPNCERNRIWVKYLQNVLFSVI